MSTRVLDHLVAVVVLLPLLRPPSLVWQASWLFESISQAAVPRIHEFNPQNLSNLAWGFGKASVPAPTLFNAIAQATLQKMSQFDPSMLQNLIQAFRNAGVEAPDLYARAGM